MAEKKKNKTAAGSTAVSKPGESKTPVPGTEVPALPPAVIETTEYGLQLRTLDDYYRFGQYLVKAKMVPETDTPESCVIKLQYGAELGLAPMQSIQNIAVINRRPVLWGDAVPAIVHGSGLMIDYREREIGERYQDNYGWEITSVRKGAAVPMVTVFTVADAKTAGLWGNAKRPPWIQYPSRMLKMRARTFNLRDNFPDVLRGIHTGEEIEDADYEVVEEEKPGDRTQGLNKQMGAVIEQESAPSAPEEPAGAPAAAPEKSPQATPAGPSIQDTAPAAGSEVLAHVEGACQEPERETEDNEAGTRLFDDLRIALADVTTLDEMQRFNRTYLPASVSRLTPEQNKKLIDLCKKKEAALKAPAA